MKISITGNGQKLDISITVVWASMRALINAVLLVIGAVAALIAAPEVGQLISLLAH